MEKEEEDGGSNLSVTVTSVTRPVYQLLDVTRKLYWQSHDEEEGKCSSSVHVFFLFFYVSFSGKNGGC